MLPRCLSCSYYVLGPARVVPHSARLLAGWGVEVGGLLPAHCQEDMRAVHQGCLNKGRGRSDGVESETVDELVELGKDY